MTNQTQVKHTPTPWYITELTHKSPSKISRTAEIQSTKINEDNYVVGLPLNHSIDKANAQFIVKAVNSYDKHIEALNDVLFNLNTAKQENLKPTSLWYQSNIDIIQEALKKEGELC